MLTILQYFTLSVLLPDGYIPLLSNQTYKTQQ
jgi:hypothetical protein